MSDLIGAAMSGDTGDFIKDTTTRNFGEDVIAASQEVPVIVDFWAPWCGPCMQLGPAIEKAVTEAAGEVKLIKLNIDDNPEIAQQMGIQSIPAVFAFKNGQPVDSFVGAVPESEIKAFLKRLVGDIGPSPIERALEQATAPAESGDLGAAANISTRARAPTVATWRLMIWSRSAITRCGSFFDDTHDTGIYSWNYLYELGQRQDELWKRYLQALEEKGLSRDA